MSCQLNPANASLARKRQKNRKEKHLIFIAIVTIVSIGAVSLQIKLKTNSNSAGYLPKKLGNVQVLTSNVVPAIREACDLHIFELEQVVSNRIKEIGITYFEGDIKPRANSPNGRNPYSQWSHTPVPKPKNSDFWSALRCGKESDRELVNRIESGMNSVGGYYIMTENKEGFIVVLPNKNLAAFLYDG